MKRFSLFFILLLPLIIIIDLVSYFFMRNTCLNCGNIFEFLKSSSISAVVIGAAAKSFLVLRKKI